MEGSEKYNRAIRSHYAAAIASDELAASTAFVTAENIDELLGEWAEGKPEAPAQIDLLSIDVDGNDYWIWSAVRSVNPRVVIIETAVPIHPSLEFIRQYDPAAIWDGTN